jgi:hypothetical protein
MQYLSLRSLFSSMYAACLHAAYMITYYSRMPILHSCMLNSVILHTFYLGPAKYPKQQCILDFTPF